jgi:hypothetical protein
MHAAQSMAAGEINGTRPAAMPGRLKLLLAAHLLLGITPVAVFLLPPDLILLPLMWALAGIPVGQAMLLAFWAGMASPSRLHRWAGMVLGVLYLAAWPNVAVLISPYNVGQAEIATLVYWIGIDSAILIVFTGVFLLIRLRFAELRLTGEIAPTGSRYQFSILSVLVATSIVAMVVGLVRATFGSSDASRGFLLNLLAVLAFSVDNVAMTWAVLAPGRMRWRVAVVLIVALLLGMSMAFANVGNLAPNSQRLWLFTAQSLVFVVPPLVVAASLLVVRSCGYRLIGKTTG